MSHTTMVLHRVVCDAPYCDQEETPEDQPYKAFKAWLQEMGWSLRKTKDLCPKHAKEEDE